MDDFNKELYIVGTGASAGGLQAISSFLSEFKQNTEQNFCVVIVQHLSGSYRSELTSILKKRCTWIVEEVTDNIKAEPGKIYVTPASKQIEYRKGVLKLTDNKPNAHPTPSINYFFKSLAEEAGSKAIGIVLSGFGDDGTTGAKHILEHGGFMICQQRDTAEQEGMPGNAINGGNCNIVLPPQHMFEEINLYIKNHRLINSFNPEKNAFDTVLEILAAKTGTDFSQYKHATIKRRITKRLDALNIKDINDYLTYVNENPTELETLFATVLIGVTQFFRDGEAFEKLKPILKDIIEKKKPGDALRVWSIGCATGEEPYSLSILIKELLEPEGKLNVQVFATDIDEQALQIARKGVYYPQSVETLPIDVVEKYFDKKEGCYSIKNNVRQQVLFSRHDVSIDPPFVRQDLIICRNLLIYFNNDLQRETLKTFHYALKEGGSLFLGKSESVSVIPDLFTQTDSKNKIFKRAEGSPIYAMNYGRFRKNKEPLNLVKNKEKSLPAGYSLLDNAKESIFKYFQHPFVVINENFQVKEIKGSMRLYMEMGEGKADVNLLKMVNKELSIDLRSLMAKLKKTGQPQESNMVKFSLFGQNHFVKMKALPLIFKMFDSAHYLVLFEKIEADLSFINLGKDIDNEKIRDYRIQELEQELTASREHIQTFTEELETTNEELQSLNEELQSANEELKSSNEEMETSNEELQSANEELHTANAELRFANKELQDKELELTESKNLVLQSEHLYKTIIKNYNNGSIAVVGHNYIIDLFGGRGVGVGKTFKNEDVIGTNILTLNTLPEENQKLKQLLDSAFEGKESRMEISYKGRVATTNAIPLFYSEDSTKVEKVMYMSHDITDYHNALKQIKESEERFRMLADTSPIMIWMENKNKENIYQSKGWLDFTGTSPEENYGEGWLQQVHEEDREKVRKSFSAAFEQRINFTEEYRLKNEFGSYRWIIDQGKPRYDHNGDFYGFIGGCIDINDQKELERKKDEFMNLASHELKTPLTTIKAYIDLMQQILENKGLSDILTYVKKADKSVSKMNRLINELLDISRIELGKMNLKKEEIEFDDFISSIVNEYITVDASHQLIIENQTGKNIHGDRKLLEQVVNNLLSNAVKYSEEGSEIRVILESDAEHIRFSVKDNGIGMDKETLLNIFDKFYQAQNEKRDGLGIGLYLVKDVVEAHQGTVEVTSEPGKGAVFIISLPIK